MKALVGCVAHHKTFGGVHFFILFGVKCVTKTKRVYCRNNHRSDALGDLEPPRLSLLTSCSNYEDECERGQVDTHASCAHVTRI